MRKLSFGPTEILLTTLLFASQIEAQKTFSQAEIDAGRLLAEQHCKTCHLFPAPNLLDKTTWENQTLPRMSIRMGLSPESVNRHPEAEILWKSGKFPKQPTISSGDYNKIIKYYVSSAPTKALPQKPPPRIGLGLKGFRSVPTRFRRAVGATTMVRIDEAKRRVYQSDGLNHYLDILDSHGRLLESLQVGNIPVTYSESGDQMYLTMIGSFTPSDIPRGELVVLKREAGKLVKARTLLKDIPRPTHSTFADLNGDQKTDFVVSMYGNNLGRLSWFENQGGGEYLEHLILDRSGAIRTEVHDFNGDGKPDLATLVAQELEAFYLFYNDGKGGFTPELVFQKHPLFGHSAFEMVDFNRDGKLDIVVTNGDNGEYPSPPKNYHGIRVYLNRDGRQFDQALFIPLNGAFRAMARDYDQDGDTDIAAVSYFPDYVKSPRESFVYYENKGKNQFAANTFRNCISGRWLTMDAGDLDGDGDIDLALGNYAYGPTSVPSFLMEAWKSSGPPVLILENMLNP